jgi:hypothetical protein
MLLVFLLLQLVPAPARDAIVSRYGDRHTWAVVRTEMEPQWQCFHPEARPVSITLSFSGGLSPAAGWAPNTAGDGTRPPAIARLESFDDALTSWREMDSSEPAATLENYSPTVPAIELATVSDGPVIVPWLLGDLSHQLAASSVTLSGVDPLPEGGGGPTGGPGGGVGGALPEPAATIPLIGMVIPLILRRRSPRQNPAS